VGCLGKSGCLTSLLVHFFISLQILPSVARCRRGGCHHLLFSSLHHGSGCRVSKPCASPSTSADKECEELYRRVGEAERDELEEFPTGAASSLICCTVSVESRLSVLSYPSEDCKECRSRDMLKSEGERKGGRRERQYF
jgi:hypothetical protein